MTKTRVLVSINAVAACVGLTILIAGNGWARVFGAVALTTGLGGLALTRTGN